MAWYERGTGTEFQITGRRNNIKIRSDGGSGGKARGTEWRKVRRVVYN